MKQSEAKQFAPLIQAWGEGKTLQWRPANIAPWQECSENGLSFLYPIENYRIKPETVRRVTVQVDVETDQEASNIIYALCHKAIAYSPVDVRHSLSVVEKGSK